jgi:hypothetical protein
VSENAGYQDAVTDAVGSTGGHGDAVDGASDWEANCDDAFGK